MRKLSALRLAVLSFLLMVTAVLVYGGGSHSPVSRENRPALEQTFAAIHGWPEGETIPLSREVKDALDLDDYLFRTCKRGDESVTLYIGYYHAARKVGAAHDPLVCFQGQGWKISSRERGDYTLSGREDLKISYTSMVAERESNRELVVYWFQTNGLAAATTFGQKLAMIRARFVEKGERNAFVRISASLNGQPPEVVRRRIFAFVDDFYPEFQAYLAEG